MTTADFDAAAVFRKAAETHAASPEGRFNTLVCELDIAAGEFSDTLFRAVSVLAREVATHYDMEDQDLIFNDLLNEIDPAWRVKVGDRAVTSNKA